MPTEEESSLARFAAPGGGRLTPDMVAAFENDGVIVLTDFVPPAACDALRARALELVDAFDPAETRSVFSTTGREHQSDRYFLESGDKIRFFLEADAFDASGRLRGPKGDCLNKMGHAMHDLDPVFERFSHRAELAEIASRLGNADPGLVQSMYIFKPPRIGGEVVCHQDSTYLYTEPESCLGFWFAIEDATVDNGCMFFIPRGHKGALKQRSRRLGPLRVETEILDRAPWPEHQRLAAEATKGTLVVFHGRAPHLSGPNHSDRSRHAFTLHAIDRRCSYPADNWLQRGPGMPLRGFA